MEAFTKKVVMSQCGWFILNYFSELRKLKITKIQYWENLHAE